MRTRPDGAWCAACGIGRLYATPVEGLRVNVRGYELALAGEGTLRQCNHCGELTLAMDEMPLYDRAVKTAIAKLEDDDG